MGYDQFREPRVFARVCCVAAALIFAAQAEASDFGSKGGPEPDNVAEIANLLRQIERSKNPMAYPEAAALAHAERQLGQRELRPALAVPAERDGDRGPH